MSAGVGRRATLLRRALLAAQAAVLLWAAMLGVAELPAAALLLAVQVLAEPWRTRLDRRLEAPSAALAGQLLADTAALVLFFALTGGADNPFVPLLLLPLSLAAALLEPRWTAAIGAAAALGYFLLLFQAPARSWFDHGSFGHNAHRLGMWLNFVVSALLIGVLVGRAARALLRHEQALAEARERRLRADRLLAVAAVAAGTAHRLATPLATALLHLDTLRRRGGSPRAAELDAAIEPLQRCRRLLDELVSAARGARVTPTRHPRPAAWLGERLAAWRAQHPRLAVTARIDPALEPTRLACDETLEQALDELADNAAAAGARRLELEAVRHGDWLQLRLEDDGPGMEAERRDRAACGLPSARGGLGLGLLLAQAAIDRFGGRLHLADGRKGLRVDIALPLTEDDADA
ncbi:MAG: two-component sensor histidine kinase [Gammaproteobacteria bacterium]|nr:MAG: two-component sensor histidine kinase [Gammaproteobacteria bacterium]